MNSEFRSANVPDGFALRRAPDAPALFTFDYAEYAADLDDVEASDEGKAELLRLIWEGIVIPCVQMGWGLHPIDEALGGRGEAACGSLAQSGHKSSSQPVDEVECKDAILAARFDAAAQEQTKRGAP